MSRSGRVDQTQAWKNFHGQFVSIGDTVALGLAYPIYRPSSFLRRFRLRCGMLVFLALRGLYLAWYVFFAPVMCGVLC